MDDARLAEIAARATAVPTPACYVLPGRWRQRGRVVYATMVITEAEADLCSHAREDILALVAEVQRLRAELESYEEPSYAPPAECLPPPQATEAQVRALLKKAGAFAAEYTAKVDIDLECDVHGIWQVTFSSPEKGRAYLVVLTSIGVLTRPGHAIAALRDGMESLAAAPPSSTPTPGAA